MDYIKTDVTLTEKEYNSCKTPEEKLSMSISKLPEQFRRFDISYHSHIWYHKSWTPKELIKEVWVTLKIK